MNWYVAKLVFRVISGDGDHQAQFDEQLIGSWLIILIAADIDPGQQRKDTRT